MDAAPRGADDTPWLRRAFIACAVLALAAVFGHRYPAGIDLPQHANLIQIWARYDASAYMYRHFYEINPFAPYVGPYLLALPVAKLFGALASLKFVLALAALATPYLMIRWLRSIGGEPWFGLLGFLVAFGFGYQWGFLSFSVTAPLSFGFLEIYERLRTDPTWKRAVLAAVLLVALFFCHGIVFAMVGLAAGLQSLVAVIARPRPLAQSFLRLFPFLPPCALPLLWIARENASAQGGQAATLFDGWPPAFDRMGALFGGLFSAWPSYTTSVAGLLLVLALYIAARAVPHLRLRAALPFLVALVLFLAVPEWVFGVWLVGTRLSHFVHAFAPAFFLPTVVGRGVTRLRFVTVALVVVGLVALNVRLFVFNRELAGLDVVAEAIEPGWDVQGLIHQQDHTSEAFGPGQFGQVMAWITADRGGLLENDHGRYFQLPIERRHSNPWVPRYRYYIAHGPVAGTEAILAPWDRVRLAARSGSWSVFESTRPYPQSNDFQVLRHAQDQGEPTFTGPRDFAGVAAADALLTRTASRVHVRARRAAKTLTARTAIVDGVGAAIFSIHDGSHELWRSGLVNAGEPAQPISLDVSGKTDLLLRVRPAAGAPPTQAAWIDLRLSN